VCGRADFTLSNSFHAQHAICSQDFSDVLAKPVYGEAKEVAPAY
jgi:hypothetical protein